MKSLNSILCLSIILFLSPLAYCQENQDPSGESVSSSTPKVVRIYVEYYEVTILELAEIMSEPKTNGDDSKLRAELLAKAKAGKVTLLESQTVVSRSGEQSSTNSVTEYIYPTRYESPKSNDDELEKVHSALVIPTDFETRALGSNFLIEPIIGEDGNTIYIDFMSSISYHVGETIWGKDPNSDVIFKMPTFYTLRMDTSFTLRNGKFLFVSALSPKDDKGIPDTAKKIMVLIKADILNTGQ